MDPQSLLIGTRCFLIYGLHNLSANEDKESLSKIVGLVEGAMRDQKAQQVHVSTPRSILTNQKFLQSREQASGSESSKYPPGNPCAQTNRLFDSLGEFDYKDKTPVAQALRALYTSEELSNTNTERLPKTLVVFIFHHSGQHNVPAKLFQQLQNKLLYEGLNPLVFGQCFLFLHVGLSQRPNGSFDSESVNYATQFVIFRYHRIPWDVSRSTLQDLIAEALSRHGPF